MTTSSEMFANPHASRVVATRVIMYAVQLGKDLEFQAWQESINEKCQQFSGFLGVDVHPPSANESRDDWIVVYRFQNEKTLKVWLESKEYAEALKTAPIFTNKQPAYMLSGGRAPDDGLTIVAAHKVLPGKEAEYAAANKLLNDAAARFPGFAGCEVFRPTANNDEYVTLVHFNNQENMNRWLASPERKAGREALYRTTADHRAHVVATGFGSWFAFNAADGIAAAAWKQAMIVICALFPIDMILTMTIGNILSKKGASLAVNIFVNNAASTIILTWLAMPLISRILNWWLSPKSTSKQTWIGLFLILILYVIEFVIFDKIYQHI